MNPHEGLTPDEHQERHILLHAALDELLAEYLLQTGREPAKARMIDVMRWAYEQSYAPTVIEGGKVVLHRTGYRASRALWVSWMSIANVLTNPARWNRPIRPEPGLAKRIQEICALAVASGMDLNHEYITIFLNELEEAACAYAADPNYRES